jgi:hypothetical protein
MKIFIQGRKDGYNTLYPKPTPREFYQFASDIQRIDAQNNSQYYGKSLYSIAFNGSGCIFTKYIIGYDTLRSYLGNIGISVFLPSNEKMSGADIKALLDELINIYTTNYCPDFKINNQKQEDWLLFSSYASNFDSKVKTISSDENFHYGNKDAAYIFYNNTDEIEKYLESPYQEEYKEYKQILFVDNQSQILLEVIKHDQNANLTQIVDLKNPKYKLIYRQVAEGGLKIDVKVNGSTRHSKSKVKRKDILTISWEKPYHKKIERIGKWEEIGMEFLKIDDYEGKIEVLEKSLEVTEKKIKIEITDSNDKPIIVDNITCTCIINFSKEEKQVENDLIVFKGEEQKEKWTISAKKDSFSGEKNFTPENESIVKLVLREKKIIQSNQPQNILFLTQSQEIPKSENKNRSLIIYTLFALIIFCFLGIGYYFYDDILGNPDPNYALQNNKTKVEELPKLTDIEIINYVEGDSLILERLEQFKTDWGKLTPVIETVTSNDNNSTAEKQDSTELKNWKKIDESLDRAIKKRVAINECDFGFFKDNNNKIIFPEAQLPFKKAINKINENVKLGDVSQLTLTQIADSINKILETPIEKKSNDEEKDLAIKKSSPKSDNNKSKIKKSNQTPGITISDEEQEIINYLEGSEFSFNMLTKYEKSNKSKELKQSINLAIEFWSLDGSKPKTYTTYFSNVKNDKYLKENKTLNNFLNEEIKKKKESKYPPSLKGYKTISLSKFIGEATK